MSATRTPRVVVPEKAGKRPLCGARSKGVGYRCVRPKGHRGRHATYWLTDADSVGMPGEVLAVWP